MEKIEPILEFRLSHPQSFHCSFCGTVLDEGEFVITGEVSDLIAAFRAHVKQYHLKGEDFSQAERIVREATREE